MANGQVNAVLGHLRRLIRQQGAGELADGRLLERFINGRDEAAFEVLVWRHGPMVLALARRLLHSPHDAEDVLQATFLTLVRKAGSIGKRDALGSWLYKVAYRIAVRLRTRLAKTASSSAVEDLPAADHDADPSRCELRPLLDEALQRLPEKYRIPIILCCLEGKTHREAADQLGCPTGTVSTRLTRGREMLRKQLTRRGIALSTTLLAAELSQQAAPAAVTSLVVNTVVRAASSPAAAATSASVIQLVEGVCRAMFWGKVKTAAMAFVMVGVLVATGAVFSRPVLALMRSHVDEGRERTAPDQPAPVPAEQPTKTILVQGRVVAPDGKPVANARLYWPRIPKTLPKSEEDIEIPERAQSGTDGGFRFELPRSDVKPEFSDRIGLLALADGYGAGWAKLDDKANAGLTVRLTKEQPIRGRLVSAEGKPLAGVSLSIVTLLAPRGTLDDFLTAWKQEWGMATQQVDPMYLPLGNIHATGSSRPMVKTDKDGRFELRGAGADQVVLLKIKGTGLTQSVVYVVNRPGFDPVPLNRAVQEKIPPRLRIPGQPPLLYGPTFDFVADASRVIEGTVREMDTGKPIKGVSVWAAAGYNNGVNAVSDADGRFRLVGLSRLKEYRLHATPDVKSPWLRRSLRVPDAAGVQPIRADIELVRGLTVTGRVIDRATGKGVKSGIRFVPLPGNKYFDKPGYDSYRFDRSMQATNAAGQFRLPIIPGGGVLLVQAHGSEKMIAGIRVSPYKLAEFDAADRKRVPVVGTGQDRRFIAAGNSLEFLGIENACKVVDPAGDAGTVTCDVYLDRGKELTVKIQDAAGQPLTGALVSGMTASFPITFPISESSCTVYALDPTQPRQLVVYHAGRKLAGKLTVRGDEKEPPVVKLTPVGSVTGRVLDGDGLPLAGADVYLSAPGVAAQELYRTLNRQHEAIRTNKDGRFRCDGLVADLKFGISFRKGNAFLVGEPQIGLRQVGPGKTLDLGDIRTKRFN